MRTLAFARKMHEGSPQHLSNIAWAASQLGAHHFQVLLFLLKYNGIDILLNYLELEIIILF